MSGVPPSMELSNDELRELREMFDLLDEDKSGTICVDEVHSLMRLLGTQNSHRDTTSLLKEIDPDGSGELSFEEFVRVTAGTVETKYNRKDATRAFRMFADANAPEGRISKDALHKALMQYCSDEITDKDAWNLIDQMDVDMEGWVDYQKKVNMFLK